MSVIEKEVKLPVKDLAEAFQKLEEVLFIHDDPTYIRDTIYGDGGKKKIRMRQISNGGKLRYLVEWKNRVKEEAEVKTEEEVFIYVGWDVGRMMRAIRNQGKFKPENSYEKIRWEYGINSKVKVTLDIYPFGDWIEIEGEEKDIWEVARALGYSKADAILETADELYLKWAKEHKQPELWDVRFGLEEVKIS